MPLEISIEKRTQAKGLLSQYFHLSGEEAISEASYLRLMPLLSLLCADHTLHTEAGKNLLVQPENITGESLTGFCDSLFEVGVIKQKQLTELNGCLFRLPTLIDEFPVNTDPINTAIEKFNEQIEQYHNAKNRHSEEPAFLTNLQSCYHNIITQIKEKGVHCHPEALAPLLSTLCSWSNAEDIQAHISKHFPIKVKDNDETYSDDSEPKHDDDHNDNTDTVQSQTEYTHSHTPDEIIVETGQPKSYEASDNQPQKKIRNPSTQSNDEHTTKPKKRYKFPQKSTHGINKAGLMRDFSTKTILNAFGMKPGGHTDAISTPTPKLVRMSIFMNMFLRELSQKMDLTTLYQNQKINDISSVILIMLHKSGLTTRHDSSQTCSEDTYFNPFSTKPMVLQSTHTMEKILRDTCNKKGLKLEDKDNATIIELLDSFVRRIQANPNIALGIGANHDGTIERSNDSGIHPFQFSDEHYDWSEEFSRISQHRQGPAQAYMNAMSVAKYEALSAFAQSFEYMSTLQPHERQATLYDALVDNLFADLFPHPDRFENKEPGYERYSKIFSLSKKNIDKIYEHKAKSHVGIYKKNGSLVPKHRIAGTQHIIDMPHDMGDVCGATRNSYNGNPLAQLQEQYAQSLYPGKRGNHIYCPTAKDVFIPDPFGQLVQMKNGSLMPLIGLIPKNFDKKIKHNTEACCSFVVRMIHSSKLKSHSPEFNKALEAIKAQFLPNMTATQETKLPEHLRSIYTIQQSHKKWLGSLTKQNFEQSIDCFYSFFMSIILQIQSYQTNDQHCDSFLYDLIRDISRAKANKRTDREYFASLVRELELYTPISAEEGMRISYTKAVAYLKEIIDSFFPKPSEENAKRFEKLASKSAMQLKKTLPIIDYFDELKQTFPQANTSRTLTPGMWLSRMTSTENGEAKPFSVKQVLQLHTKNFDSGYRGINGEMDVTIEERDRRIDYLIKIAGSCSAVLQTMPCQCCSPCSCAYNMYQDIKVSYENKGVNSSCFFGSISNAIYQVASGIKECFCYIPQTALSYFASEEHDRQTPVIGNPFSIPATPGNTAGLRVQMSNEIRLLMVDFIHSRHQGAESNQPTSKSLIEKMADTIKVYCKGAYSDELSDEYITKITNHLLSQLNCPYFDRALDTLAEIIKTLDVPNNIKTLLIENLNLINSSFLNNLYLALTTKEFNLENNVRNKPQRDFIKNLLKQIKMEEEKRKQNSTNTNMETPLLSPANSNNTKEILIETFTPNGEITSALDDIDLLVQTWHDRALSIWDKDMINNMVNSIQIESALTAEIDKLQNCLLATGSLEKDRIEKIQEQINIMNKFLRLNQSFRETNNITPNITCLLSNLNIKLRNTV